jgi:RNA polymerase-binding transcription factor DksA
MNYPLRLLFNKKFQGMAKSKKSAKPAKTNSGKSKKASDKKISKPAPKKAVAKKTARTSAKDSKSSVKKPAARKVESAKNNGVTKTHFKSVAKNPGKPVIKTAVLLSIKPSNKGKEKEKILKTRYSDPELAEFRQLILEKVEAAKKELKYLQDQISRAGDNSADETENKYASMDDGGSSMEREYLNQMAARQRLYLDHLDKALVRIQNKTYGICRVTGKLIEKERLRAVPHATLSMEAKMHQAHPQPTNNV